MKWVAVQKYDLMNVAGVTFNNKNGSSRQRIISGLARGMKVKLLRESGNEHDANAIAVLVSGQQIGYIPAEWAETLAPILDNEQADLRGEIADVWSFKSEDASGVTWTASLALTRWELREKRSGLAELAAFLQHVFGPAGGQLARFTRGGASRLRAKLGDVVRTGARSADGQLRRLAGEDATFHLILRGIALLLLLSALLVLLMILF